MNAKHKKFLFLQKEKLKDCTPSDGRLSHISLIQSYRGVKIQLNFQKTTPLTLQEVLPLPEAFDRCKRIQQVLKCSVEIHVF